MMQLVLADSARLKPANTSEGTEPSADWRAKSMSLRIGMQACRPQVMALCWQDPSMGMS